MPKAALYRAVSSLGQLLEICFPIDGCSGVMRVVMRCPPDATYCRLTISALPTLARTPARGSSAFESGVRRILDAIAASAKVAGACAVTFGHIEAANDVH